MPGKSDFSQKVVTVTENCIGIRGDTPNPLVTIGLPVFNGARFLPHSLKSLLSQSVSDFELIISDNASTDGSDAICREWAARDNRIRFIRQSRNIGAAHNWNFVAREARGKYLKWSSVNDYSPPYMLEKCLAVMEVDPTVALCHGRTCLVDEDTGEESLYDRDVSIMESLPHERFDNLCRSMVLNNAQTGLIRCEMLSHTLYDRSYPGGDIVLMAELALQGKYVLLPEVLLYRRMGKNTFSSMLSDSEKHTFLDPTSRRRLRLGFLRLHSDYFYSVLRARIPLLEKLRTLLIVQRYMRWGCQNLWMQTYKRIAGLPHVSEHFKVTKKGNEASESAETESRSASMSVRIGLFGPYFSQNLGDTAIQQSVMASLQARISAVEFLGICPDPKDTLNSLGIPAFPIDGCGPSYPLYGAVSAPVVSNGSETIAAGGLWTRSCGFRRIASEVRKLQLLIVSGGGQIDDFWGGPWELPFSILVWTGLARWYGVPVAYLGIGMDRLDSRLSRFFVLWALRLANLRRFRDAGTLNTLKSLGLKGSSNLCPDLAFSYPIEPEEATERSAPFVVINPISIKTWSRDGDDPRHEGYLRNLAGICCWVVERGMQVRIVCSQVAMDQSVAVQVMKMAGSPVSANIQICDTPGVVDYFKAVQGAEIVVASRLHGAILSLVAGVPVVAISPLPKVSQLMIEMGLRDYVLPLQGFELTELINKVDNALAFGAVLRRHIKARNRKYREQLAHTFDEVVNLQAQLSDHFSCHPTKEP